MRLFLLLLFICSPLMAEQYFHLPLGQTIEVYLVGSKNGDLKHIQSVSSKRHFGGVVTSPDTQFLYAVISDGKKRENPGIQTYQIDRDGKLKMLAEAKIKAYPVFMNLAPDGKYLLGAAFR